MNVENGTNIKQYKIISPIGKGGMGEVYLANDTKLNRKVALKILPAEFAEDSDRMSRFVREAQSASALNHPNIITIHEIGESAGTHFIATEFIDGKTLGDYAKSNPLNYKSALEIAIQVASALDEAHSAGIVHRDIKPDNVMIRTNGLAKILDFGIAKLSETSPANLSSEDATAIQKPSTSPGMIIGTANYMSPEQAKGEAVDARTDIFSFGVVLYEMLSGHLPFAGKTPMEIIGAVIHKEPLPLDTDLPNEITKIINKCLRKDRNERYQTVRDVLNNLKEIKLELDVQDKLEKTIQPHAGEQKTQMLKAVATVDDSNQTTAAETRNDSITIKKSSFNKFAVGVLAILLVSAIGLGYWFYSKSNTKQIESIAVMPFVNESGNADVEYLSDGMTETLIKSLSQIPDLNVKPRSSVFRYKGKDTDLQTIARDLNVQAILNGRVVQRGEQLTLSLELIDVSKDSVIWTESYNRKQSDLVSLQSEIAREVSTNLKAKLSGADEQKVTKTGTTDPEAYQAYLKGRYYWNQRTAENLKKAIEQFNAAVEKDPSYALAYVGLADSYVIANEYLQTPLEETLSRSKAYANKALELDDSLGEAYATLGRVNQYSWDWAESEKAYKRSIELNPNYATARQWYSRLLVAIGRRDEALAEIKRANEIDPLSAPVIANIAMRYREMGDYQSAIVQGKKLIELDPNYSGIYWILGLSYLKLGQNDEAIENFEKAVELSNRSNITLAFLGYGHAVTGKRTEANTIAKELEERYAEKKLYGFSVATVYAGLSDKDKAFEWLERDFQNKGDFLGEIKILFPIESLRDDPRYKDLLKRMNLPE